MGEESLVPEGTDAGVGCDPPREGGKEDEASDGG